MKIQKIGIPDGFHVILESAGWRMACHAYHKAVNSIDALKKWGVHVDSDEAFVLIQGKGLLTTAGTMDDPQNVEIQELCPGVLYCVEKGERHAIVLKEGSTVLITENRDMSNSVEQEMTEAELQIIKEKYMEI